MTKIRLAFALSIILITSSCVTNEFDEAVGQNQTRIMNELLGSDAYFYCQIPIVDGNPAKESKAIAKIKSGKSTKIVDSVKSIIAYTHGKNDPIVFGGASSAWNSAVTIAALEDVRPDIFEGYTMYFFGNEGDFIAVSKEIIRVGAIPKWIQM